MYFRFFCNRLLAAAPVVLLYNHHLDYDNVTLLCVVILSLGLFINSIASVVVDPILNKMKIMDSRDYKLYVAASAIDTDIKELNAEKILYRDLLTGLLMVLPFGNDQNMFVFNVICILIAAFRFKKFNSYIVKRIDCYQKTR